MLKINLNKKLYFARGGVNLSFVLHNYLFLLLVFLSSNVKAQCPSNLLCPHTRLVAELPSSPSCTGCMLREVEFHFSPYMDNISTEFQTCNLQIKGEVTFTGGVGSLVSVCKQLKDKNNKEVKVIPNSPLSNQFEVKDDQVRTFEYRTPNQTDKYAFSLLIMATPGTQVSVKLIRIETSMHKDLTSCDQLYSNFCYLAEKCNSNNSNQPIDYTFDYQMDNSNSCSNITPPISVYIDYANPSNITETQADYQVYAKNNSSNTVILNEASFVFKRQTPTLNTTLSFAGQTNFIFTDVGNDYSRLNTNINLLFNPNQIHTVGIITISSILPTRYGEAIITNKPNSGYIKYVENSIEHCCQSDLTSGTLKLNENIGYPACSNNDDVTFRVIGGMKDAKKARIIIMAKSKNDISLNHLWVNLRLNMPSSWSFSEQNMSTCPGPNQSCSYNHTNTSDCIKWTQNTFNPNLWNAEFGFCSSTNTLNLSANSETQIGYIELRNQVSCSSDQITIDPMFVQYGTNTTTPCVPPVMMEGFPLRGTDYNVSGNMTFKCVNLLPGISNEVTGINVYEKPNASCSGDCAGDCLLTCFGSGTTSNPISVYPIAVDPATKYYGSVCRESNSPFLSIEPCKSDQARQFVSTADLVAINKHILGTVPFTQFNQFFAADVDHNLIVQTQDMINIRRVILWIDEDFSPATYRSWRFIPTEMQFQIQNGFPSPSNPQGCQQAAYGTKKSYNYNAIKIGDVNNCIPVLSGNKVMLTDTDHPTYQIGDLVKIKIKAGASFSLEGIQAGLGFNPDQISFSGVNLNQTSTPILITNSDFVGSNQASQGKLRFLWYDDQGGVHNFSSGDNIIELYFTALQPISSTNNLVHLDNDILESMGYDNDNAYSNLTLNGQYGFNAQSTEDRSNSNFKNIGLGYEIMEVELIPNPSNHNVSIRVKTPESGEYYIKVMDETGKQMLSYKRNLEKGSNQYILEGAERLPAGLYFFSLVAPSGAAYNTKLLRQ